MGHVCEQSKTIYDVRRDSEVGIQKTDAKYHASSVSRCLILIKPFARPPFPWTPRLNELTRPTRIAAGYDEFRTFVNCIEKTSAGLLRLAVHNSCMYIMFTSLSDGPRFVD